MQEGQEQQVRIEESKITDDILKGRYANFMRVGHTAQEFILEFLNLFPPRGIAVSRIIISPGHLKRILRALSTNMARYEERFGKIEEAPEPKKELGFQA